MTEAEVRRKIEELEKEIKYCEEDIYWAEEKRKSHIAEAERYNEKASNGGGLVFTAEYMRGMSDMHYSDAKIDIQEIKALERRKDNLTRQLRDFQNILAKSIEGNAGQKTYEPKGFSTPGGSKGNTLNSVKFRERSTFMGINKVLMKESLRISIPYAAAIIVIWYVSGIMDLGLLTGLVMPFIGPIFFAVLVRKKFLCRHTPNHKVLNIFVSYILGFMITFPMIFGLSTSTIIMMIVACFIAGAAMDKMGRGW